MSGASWSLPRPPLERDGCVVVVGCISWQEMQEKFPPLKQGDACTPLISRPVTRIMPSPQKRLRKKLRLGFANEILLRGMIRSR